MAKAARTPPNDDGEIKKKDFAGAVGTYKSDIAGAIDQVGTHSQKMSTAYKHIEKNYGIQPSAMKQAIKEFKMEDAKRDDYQLCLDGLRKQFGIARTPDLVDGMEAPQRPKPTLVTIPTGPAGDTDLAGEA